MHTLDEAGSNHFADVLKPPLKMVKPKILPWHLVILLVLLV